MSRLTDDTSIESVDEFVKTINKLRLDNKNKWFWWHGYVTGYRVELKCYNTWLQVFRVEGVNWPNCMDESVTKFKEALRRPF